MLRLRWLACALLLAACGPFCSSSFTLANLAVDAAHPCPAGARAAPYDLNATVAADNHTSSSVAIRSATAAMIVSAVHGRWQQAVGFRYDVGEVPITPKSVGSGSKTALKVTIPSACSNEAHQGTTDNYADYTVELTVRTTAGDFKLTSQNRHRILAP